MINIHLASKEFKESMEATLQKALHYAEIIKFKKTDLDFLKDKRLESAIENLENVIYFIRIKDNCEIKANTICEIIQKFKQVKNQKIKFPKVNGCNDNSDNKILYIGKSKGKIKGRFVSHLTINSPTVYGLHLEYWQNNPEFNKLELELYYAEIDLEEDDRNSEILELLETSLHKKYKPILGRTGH